MVMELATMERIFGSQLEVELLIQLLIQVMEHNGQVWHQLYLIQVEILFIMEIVYGLQEVQDQLIL